jgi:hypothetical protein
VSFVKSKGHHSGQMLKRKEFAVDSKKCITSNSGGEARTMRQSLKE